jgi:hypothetical protein
MNIDKKIEEVLMKNSHIPWDYYKDEHGVETDRCLDYKKALPVIKKLVLEVQKETEIKTAIKIFPMIADCIRGGSRQPMLNYYKQLTGENHES